jgi:DNA-binding HxlR family transcriptional regulator
MRTVPPAQAEAVQPTIHPTLMTLFKDFADQSAEFAREIIGQGDASATGRMDHALLNLRIARTVFGKWSVEILTFLYTERTARFQEIRKALGDISARVLSLKLAGLEGLGFVHRTVLATRPPGVEYSLTEKGLQVAKLGEPVFLYLRMTEGLLNATGP